MNRWWSIPFALVPVLGVAAFAAAIIGWGPLSGLWLPRNYSRQGETIDHLFVLIHVIIGAMFVATSAFLAWTVWRFAARGQRARYSGRCCRLSSLFFWLCINFERGRTTRSTLPVRATRHTRHHWRASLRISLDGASNTPVRISVGPLPMTSTWKDIVPGLTHRIWFTPLGRAEMEFVCAELCGWGHYKMRGRLRIVSRAEFNAFLNHQR
jgi:cytochrome c oxidase subunit 2